MASKQFVLFKIEQEEYAVDITDVNEITDVQKPSSLPESDDHIDGVINLRGEVIPVINLRRIFDIPKAVNKEEKIVVVGKKDSKRGYIVDEATNVLTIDEDEIVPSDDLVLGKEVKLLTGVAKYQNRLILVLDLEKISELKK